MEFKEAHKTLPEIARQLHVDAVVEGSVLRSGDRVRIAVQLIHAPTDRHLWAKTYERDLRDVLGLQSQVASAIAQEIQIKLTPQEAARVASSHPVDQEAYEAYLKGRYYWNKRTDEGTKKAIEYLKRAIEKDPNYALAYAGLADSYVQLVYFGGVPPKESFPRAKAAALKALELDDRLAEAHAALGRVLLQYDWDGLGAERQLQRARELNPNYAQAYVLNAMHLANLGRLDEAIAAIKRAGELDPLSLNINTNVGVFFYFARQYDQAIEQEGKTIELDPNFPPGTPLARAGLRAKGKVRRGPGGVQKDRRP